MCSAKEDSSWETPLAGASSLHFFSFCTACILTAELNKEWEGIAHVLWRA